MFRSFQKEVSQPSVSFLVSMKESIQSYILFSKICHGEKWFNTKSSLTWAPPRVPGLSSKS